MSQPKLLLYLMYTMRKRAERQATRLQATSSQHREMQLTLSVATCRDSGAGRSVAKITRGYMLKTPGKLQEMFCYNRNLLDSNNRVLLYLQDLV